MEEILRIRMHVLTFFIGTIMLYGQNSNNELFVNVGKMSVGSTGILSTNYNFANLETASVISDGQVYYYRDFHNDGTFAITANKKTGTTVFTRIDNEQGKQLISGDGLSSFYNVVFDNSRPKVAFDLKNNIDISGQADFKQGIVKVDSLLNSKTQLSNGMISFLSESSVKQVSDQSHVEGLIEKIGKDSFEFPKGDKGFYRPASISYAKQSTDAFVGQYIFNDQSFFRSRPTLSGVINQINNKEYWLIDKGNNTVSDIVLTLSWDSRTTPPELLINPEKDLHIVRWDNKLQLWVDEGGIVDLNARQITTPTSVKGYGFFTLATVKTDWIIEGDVVIYNLVSTNDDGKNDYFLIDKISRFPNNTVQIFNRWGIKVFETSNYDALGNGTTNVFRGYSQGRVTIAKDELLPTGTYFYVVSYEYKDANGSKMIKKTGYLHLDTH